MSQFTKGKWKISIDPIGCSVSTSEKGKRIMAKFRPKEAWGLVSCDDGHYLICTGRVPVTCNTSSARVIGTARDRDTAILMAAAPDLYNNVKALLHDIALNDERRVHGEIRELARIIEDIDGKEE